MPSSEYTVPEIVMPVMGGAQQEPTLVRVLRARDKAFRAANFYLRKNTTLDRDAPMLADSLRQLSLQCQEWLRGELMRPFAGTTVAVTHFAPSLASADPRYGQVPGTAGFCNALENLFPLAQIWMHGHLHCPNDYTVSGTHEEQAFACRVLANPRGYAEKNEQPAFREAFVIDVAD